MVDRYAAIRRGRIILEASAATTVSNQPPVAPREICGHPAIGSTLAVDRTTLAPCHYVMQELVSTALSTASRTQPSATHNGTPSVDKTHPSRKTFPAGKTPAVEDQERRLGEGTTMGLLIDPIKLFAVPALPVSSTSAVTSSSSINPQSAPSRLRHN